MSLRKMCALLAVLSAVTVLVGVWALVKANKESDTDPTELSSLEAGQLADGKTVTLTADTVMPYVCYISDSESEESAHRYRYYPVQYRSKPLQFVLVCVPSDRFAEFEGLIGKSGGKVTVEGYLRKTEARTQAAVDELVQTMAGLDENGNAAYADRFLTYYVEPATLRSYELQRDIGLILLIGGMVMGAVGVIGFFAFRVEEEDERRSEE